MKQLSPQDTAIQNGIARWVTPILLSIVGFLIVAMMGLFINRMDAFDSRMEAIEKNQLVLMSGEIRVQYLEKQITDLQRRIENLENQRNNQNKQQPISSLLLTEFMPAKEYYVKRKEYKQPPI